MIVFIHKTKYRSSERACACVCVSALRSDGPMVLQTIITDQTPIRPQHTPEFQMRQRRLRGQQHMPLCARCRVDIDDVLWRHKRTHARRSAAGFDAPDPHAARASTF